MSVIVFKEFLQGKNFRVQMGNENIYFKFLWYLLDATHMPTLPALKGQEPAQDHVSSHSARELRLHMPLS